MPVMKSHERSETIMKTKITVVLAMIMILSLFVSGFVFAGTIAYTYDNNGNLLKRNVSVPADQYAITVSAVPCGAF